MKCSLFFALAFILLAALPVSAQNSNLDAEQTDNLRVVMDAIQRIETLDSFKLDSEQVLNEQFEFSFGKEGSTKMNMRSHTTSHFDVAGGEDTHDVAGSIIQEIIYAYDTEKSNTILTYDLVMLDNHIFVRVNASDMSDLLGDYIPEGWIEATKTGVIEKYPFLLTFNQEYVHGFFSQYLPVNETTIQGIEVAADQAIDGQPMQVFELQFDSAALMDTAPMEVLSTGIALAGTDALANAAITLTVFIGQEDGFIHRLENLLTVNTEFETEGMSTPIKVELSSTKSYSDFNEPVTIEAPQMGS